MPWIYALSSKTVTKYNELYRECKSLKKVTASTDEM